MRYLNTDDPKIAAAKKVLDKGEQIRIIYDNPHYWNVFKSEVPPPTIVLPSLFDDAREPDNSSHSANSIANVLGRH